MSSFSLSNAIRVFVSVVVRVYHCLSLSSSSLSVLALVWSLPAQHLPARRSLTRSTKSCCRFSSSKKRKKTTTKTFAAGCSCFCFRSFATTRSKSFVGASFAVDFATTRREAAVDLVARHTQTSSCSLSFSPKSQRVSFVSASVCLLSAFFVSLKDVSSLLLVVLAVVVVVVVVVSRAFTLIDTSSSILMPRFVTKMWQK